MSKNDLILRNKYKNQISKLSNDQAGVLLKALMAYLAEDNIPEMDAATDIVFSIITEDADTVVTKSTPASKNPVSQEKKENAEKIIEMYNEICTSLPKCLKVTDKRIRMINARAKAYAIEDFKKLFSLAEESDFLTGKTTGWHGCNIDWLMNESNMAKVFEGNYVNDKGKGVEKNKFINFTGRQYDANTLERKLLEVK